MLILAFLAAIGGLYFMLKWLYDTPIVFSPQRVGVALAADVTVMLLICIILYAAGMRVHFV